MGYILDDNVCSTQDHDMEEINSKEENDYDYEDDMGYNYYS